jgi:diguanylate cyclase (GGDEF)-like protein
MSNSSSSSPSSIDFHESISFDTVGCVEKVSENILKHHLKDILNADSIYDCIYEITKNSLKSFDHSQCKDIREKLLSNIVCRVAFSLGSLQVRANINDIDPHDVLCISQARLDEAQEIMSSCSENLQCFQGESQLSPLSSVDKKKGFDGMVQDMHQMKVMMQGFMQSVKTDVGKQSSFETIVINELHQVHDLLMRFEEILHDENICSLFNQYDIPIKEFCLAMNIDKEDELVYNEKIVIRMMDMIHNFIQTCITLFPEIGRRLDTFAEEVDYKAYTDEMTGLYNKPFLEKHIDYINDIILKEYSRSTKTIYRVTQVVIDGDKFKQINDTLGHSVGDDLIRGIGSVLKKSINYTENISNIHIQSDVHHDIALRTGGDEFGIFLINCNWNNISQIKNRIDTYLIEFLKSYLGIYDIDLTHFHLSVGVAHQDIPLDMNEYRPMKEMHEVADICMYNAKEEGQKIENTYSVFDMNSRNKKMKK